MALRRNPRAAELAVLGETLEQGTVMGATIWVSTMRALRRSEVQMAKKGKIMNRAFFALVVGLFAASPMAAAEEAKATYKLTVAVKGMT